MSKRYHSALAWAPLCWLALQFMCVPVIGQTQPAAPSADSSIGLKTSLVLTPEFCATLTKKGTWGVNQEKFPVGKAVCNELEPALKKVFSNLTSVDAAPSGGNAD
jgi:hypothetical protein